MARKKNTNFIEALIELASMLPWKIAVALTVVSYLGFHYVATMSNVAPQDIREVGGYTAKQLYITFSSILQYVVPIAFLIGAGISVYNNKHRHQLVEKQSGIESIRAMSWQDFELLVGEAFRRRGYSVEEHGGNAPDGGIDLVLRKSGKKTIVQCKRWKTYSINVSLVRELYGVMTAENADNCMFVTSGTYTVDAVNFTQGKPIRLIDGDELVQLVEGVQSGNRIAAGLPEITSNSIQSSVPSCPQCGSAMVSRTARKGPNAGNKFLGCSRYPACRGVR